MNNKFNIYCSSIEFWSSHMYSFENSCVFLTYTFCSLEELIPALSECRKDFYWFSELWIRSMFCKQFIAYLYKFHSDD